MYQELFEFEQDREGFFGEFGGAYIPEILHETISELRRAFDEARRDPAFWQEYTDLMATYSCRPTPISLCENLTRECGGAKIYLKREDLNHTGAHKANNVMGQGLLVKRMNKHRVIAETGAGQHGVATATMAAKLGFDCTIYMGAEDVERQRPNVFWMEQLGAEVVAVEDGTRTLKDAINAAMRDWAFSMDTTHYVLGTVCGPHPFPLMVTWFQSIIGQEARRQMLDRTGRLPDRVFACVGGGSNASGIFSGFLDDKDVELIGVEAGGYGLNSRRHAARIAGGQGQVGVAQGYKTYFMQNPEGQMEDTHSISAGLDYPAVGPEHAALQETGTADDTIVMQTEAMEPLASKPLRLQVRESWNLDALAENYQRFLTQFRPLWKALNEENHLGEEECFIARTLLIHE